MRRNLMSALFALGVVIFLCHAPLPAQQAESAAPAPHNFARWEKEVAAYERADKEKAPAKNGALFIGSSSIRLWKTLGQDFPDHKVINRGFGGSQIIDSMHFADRLIFPHEPRAVLLFAGGNDINAGKSPEQVFDEFKQFVARVHGKLPQTEIFFISLQPRISRWAQNDKIKVVNTLVEGFSKQTPKVKYIDAWDITLGPDGQARPEVFVEDKLHFNPEGYKLLAARVRPHLPAH